MFKDFYFLLKPPLKYIFVCFTLTFLLNGLIHYQIPFLANATFFITVLFTMVSVIFCTKYSTETLHIVLATSKNTLDFWKKFILMSVIISSLIVSLFLSAVSNFSGTMNDLLPPTIKIHFYILSLLIYLVNVSFSYQNQFLAKGSVTNRAITLEAIFNFIVFFIVTLLSYYMLAASLTVLAALMLQKLFSSMLVKNTIGRLLKPQLIAISLVFPTLIYLMTATLDPKNRDLSWIPGLQAKQQLTFEDLKNISNAADWRDWAHNVQHIFSPEQAVEAFIKLDSVCEQEVSDRISIVICLGDEFLVDEKKTFLPTLDKLSISALLSSDIELAQLAGIFASRKFVFNMPEDIKAELKRLSSVPGRLSVAAQNTLILKDDNYVELQVLIIKKK